MKTTRWLTVALLPSLLACGCQTLSNTESGTLGGGVLGAAIGALAGGPRHAGAGALIGGAAGAVTGGLIGNAEDKREKAHAAAVAATFAGPQHLQEIAGMAVNHISDDVIISKVRSSGLIYRLSGSDITYLKTYGVSDAVIVEMNATATRYPRPVYGPAPVYVVEPAPAPPVSVGVGVVGRIR
jgi:hypothetical protein